MIEKTGMLSRPATLRSNGRKIRGISMRASTVVTLAAIAASALAVTAGAQSAKPEPYMTDQEYMKKVGTPFPGQFRPFNNAFEKVTGDLWRAGNGTWYVGVLVTPDGI